MAPWLLLAGVLLAPSAAFLLWSWRAQRNDMALMRATETTPAADVAKLPPGSLVEVKGRLRCAAPVTGDLSKNPCAHFMATVERDYEILQYDAHHKGSYRVRKTEIVQSNIVYAPFEIEDDSGRARVLPADAIIEGIEAVDRHEVVDAETVSESVMQDALGTRPAMPIGRSASATRRCTCRSTSRFMCWAWSARIAASARRRKAPRGSAS